MYDYKAKWNTGSRRGYTAVSVALMHAKRGSEEIVYAFVDTVLLIANTLD